MCDKFNSLTNSIISLHCHFALYKAKAVKKLRRAEKFSGCTNFLQLVAKKKTFSVQLENLLALLIL